MTKQTIAVTLSLAALAAAQGVSLSKECLAGFTNLSSNNEANSCLALNQFNNIFLSPANTSVIKPVENWLKSFCGAPDCSSSTIETVVTSLETACATDLAGVNANAGSVNITTYIEQYFGTAKQILCLADTSSDLFCAVELATAAQTALGEPLSLNNLVSTYSNVLSTQQSPVDPKIACTDCTKGAIAILRQDTQIQSVLDVNNIASGTCGADFAASATALPANIAVGTGSAVPKGSSSDQGDAAATLAVATAGTLATIAGSLLVVFLA